MRNVSSVLQKYFRVPVVIVFLYVIAQLVCLYVWGYTPYNDSNGYIYLAKECVEAGTFYPIDLFYIPFLWNIGAVNAVVGSLYLFGSVMPLLILYSLMQGMMSWFVFAIAKELFSYKTAVVALCLFVLYPANYACGTSAHSEVPFIFFSLLALYLSLKNRYLFGGVCFAIANYFRPMAIIFIVALLLYMILRRISCRKYISLFVGFCLVTSSIGITNYATTGKYFTSGAMGWMGLMQYSWDNDSDKENDYMLFPNGDPNVIDESLHYDCLQRDSVWRSNFLKWLPNNKMEYVRQMPKKFCRTYVSDNINFCAFLPDKEKREYMYEELSMPVLVNDFPDWTFVQALAGVNLIYYYILLITALCGAVLYVKNKQLIRVVIPVATIVAGTALLLLVGHGEARFHQPFMAMFIMLSASFISRFVPADK